MSVNLEELDALAEHDPEGQFTERVKSAWLTISAALRAAKDSYVEDDEDLDAVLTLIVTPIATNQADYARAVEAVRELERVLAQYRDPADSWMNDRNWGGRSQNKTRRQAFEENGSVDIWGAVLKEHRAAVQQCARVLAELGHPVT